MNFQLCHRGVWVRIMFLVVLALCGSGGSCSTCCVEVDFTEKRWSLVSSSKWHSARDGSDDDGTALWLYWYLRALRVYVLRAIPSLTLCSASCGDGFSFLAACGAILERFEGSLVQGPVPMKRSQC